MAAFGDESNKELDLAQLFSPPDVGGEQLGTADPAQAGGILMDNGLAPAQQHDARPRPDWKQEQDAQWGNAKWSLDDQRPLDYVTVRLQSPGDIRRAATWRNEDGEQVCAEVTSNDALSDSGLYSNHIFGAARSYKRREQMGFIELPWPCPHTWVVNTTERLLPKLLGESDKAIKEVSNFVKDMYIGEWTGSQTWKQIRKPGTEDKFRVPALGSPVAAQAMPTLHSAMMPVLPPKAAAVAEEDGTEALPELSRFEVLQAKMLRNAVSRHLPWEASQISAALRHGQAVGGAGLPAVMATVHAAAKLLDPEEALARTRSIVPHLVKDITSHSDNAPVAPEEAEALLSDVAAQGPGQVAPPLRAAARRDFCGLWQALTVPGLDGDLEEKMQELNERMEGRLPPGDRSRAVAAVERIMTRAQAALDVALHAYLPADGGQGVQEGAVGSTKSRFTPEPQEVYWYDATMPPATFHIEDIERSHHHFQLTEEALFSQAAADSAPPAPAARVPRPARPSRSGLSTPQKRNNRRGREATYYRRGQGAQARWHVPLQDAARPGRGGGVHPVQPFTALPRQLTEEVVRYCAARPRPAGTPPSLPSIMAADGLLFIGFGGAALRQALCDIEPVSCLKRHARDYSYMVNLSKLADYTLNDKLQKLQILPLIVRSPSRLTTLRAEKMDANSGITLMQSMLSKSHLPEWMVLTDLPVLPPDLRTTSRDDQHSENGNGDDVNRGYKFLLQQSGRITTGLSDRMGNNSVRQYFRGLQAGMDAIIDNKKAADLPLLKSSRLIKDDFQCLSSRLKGKSGRMRQNLLGKRVDYSGRTVIVVDPKLELDECGLPFEIAKTVFQEFLVSLLAERYPGKEKLPERLKMFDGLPKAEQTQLLAEAMGSRCVMLNRAPTLHRLSIQAFKPKLIDGQALKIHPLVCAPFNADFDGDTMTVHVALSDEAQEELRTLMLPTKNLSSPASGAPVIGPTQDMVLGIYFLTSTGSEGSDSQPSRTCSTLQELEAMAEGCSAGELLHDHPVTVLARVLREAAPDAVEDDKHLCSLADDDVVQTTAGRALFWLMMYRAFRPPPRPEATLLEELDSAPLVELADA